MEGTALLKEKASYCYHHHQVNFRNLKHWSWTSLALSAYSAIHHRHRNCDLSSATCTFCYVVRYNSWVRLLSDSICGIGSTSYVLYALRMYYYALSLSLIRIIDWSPFTFTAAKHCPIPVTTESTAKCSRTFTAKFVSVGRRMCDFNSGKNSSHPF